VLDWFYRHGARSFDAMSNLPAALRKRLAEVLCLFATTVLEERADRDKTVKLVVALQDAHTVESVVIPEAARRTACLSTQVGCPVGCLFCASGSRGLVRNLETHEIVEQALHLAHALPAAGRLTHVVFMGIGEGLLNFERLARAIRILNAPWGMGVAARRQTVSTVGIPGTIPRLASLGLQVNLAISLHAPDDELRRRLIPHRNLLKVEEAIDEAEDYFLATGREVTFEYVLLAGVNDSTEQAGLLAKKIKPCHAHVNLIPYNEVVGGKFLRPSSDDVKAFRRVLAERGVSVTQRRGRGRGAGAACGQLRLDAAKKEGHGRS
jgi:23S rRNA (adenine2503-C2)-methyltransferase